MFEAVKKYKTFIDYANPLTKILLAAILFVMVIFIHNPNVLFHLTMLMLLMLLILSGVKLKYLILLLIFIFISGFISSLYMIFYGEGTDTLFRYGIIHITEESFIRGIHITMRGIILSLFGALVIFTSKITDVFYALMIQLKVKPKYAYSFMAAIRMVPIIIAEYFQLRQARKVRRALIHKKYISGFKGLKSTIVTLLSQSIRRAYRLGIAMESKGFTDGSRTYFYRTSFSRYDLYLMLLMAAALIAAVQLGTVITLFDTTDAR